VQNVCLASSAKQDLDNGQSGETWRPTEHDMPTLSLPSRDGNTHAHNLPLLRQSLAKDKTLARQAPALSPDEQLQTTERMVDVYDFGTSADQPRNDREMHLHHMEYTERTLSNSF
jgi:hypothetical protein